MECPVKARATTQPLDRRGAGPYTRRVPRPSELDGAFSFVYCTVTLTVVEWETAPAVAFRVIVVV